jgi:hypothetical protein
MGYVNEEVKDREEAVLAEIEKPETIVRKAKEDAEEVELESGERFEKLKREDAIVEE